MTEERCVSPRYPECDNLDHNWKAYRAIIQFLEWLSERKMTICELLGKDFPEFQPVTKNAQTLVYEYFGIDANKLERERRAMLEEQRKRNESKEKRYRRGVCGHCGKQTEVRHALTKEGKPEYWIPCGGAILICKDCEKKEKK